eukprot:6175542-Prymnesium_polylepis.1
MSGASKRNCGSANGLTRASQQTASASVSFASTVTGTVGCVRPAMPNLSAGCTGPELRSSRTRDTHTGCRCVRPRRVWRRAVPVGPKGRHRCRGECRLAGEQVVGVRRDCIGGRAHHDMYGLGGLAERVANESASAADAAAGAARTDLTSRWTEPSAPSAHSSTRMILDSACSGRHRARAQRLGPGGGAAAVVALLRVRAVSACAARVRQHASACAGLGWGGHGHLSGGADIRVLRARRRLLARRRAPLVREGVERDADSRKVVAGRHRKVCLVAATRERDRAAARARVRRRECAGGERHAVALVRGRGRAHLEEQVAAERGGDVGECA